MSSSQTFFSFHTFAQRVEKVDACWPEISEKVSSLIFYNNNFGKSFLLMSGLKMFS